MQSGAALGLLLGSILGFMAGGVPSARAASSCQIQAGQAGVVQASAESFAQQFECFGRTHARFRAEQMHILRQTSRGKLAEERGTAFIRGDFVMRLLELEDRAERLAAELPAEDLSLLEAYAGGVNAEAREHSLHWLVNDPWRVRDTLLLLLLQSFDQTRRSFEQDIVTDGHARSGHPLEMDFPWQTPILKKGEYAEKPRTAARGDALARPPLFPFAPQDAAIGSNNWVVAPRFTKSKVAMLANDPHLQLKSPPFWHWVRMKWSEGRSTHEVVGASLPGVPLVVSGASRMMAWGLTNSYVDVADAVLVPREGLRTRRVRPWIWFKWGWFKLPFFFKSFEVQEGSRLPVLPIEAPVPGHAVVVRWTGFDLNAPDFSAIWRLGQSKDVHDMDKRLGAMGLPSWNYVFADTKGNIGYRAVGRLPDRARMSGGPSERGRMLVVKASDLGAIPVLTAEQAPHVINPSRGWIATANQLQWDEAAANSVGSIHTESFRGFRIEEMLKEGLQSGHDLKSFQRIQCDFQAVDARFLLPVLLPRMRDREEVRRLAAWNWVADRECRECALFRVWMKELGDPQWIFARATQGDDDSRAGLYREADLALESAVQRLAPWRGPWLRWGDVHRAAFPATEAPRPFEIPSLDALGASLSTAGDDHSVSPGSSDFIENGQFAAFSHHSGPSQRLVVELSDPPRIHFVLPEGSAQREAWANCSPLTHLTW